MSHKRAKALRRAARERILRDHLPTAENSLLVQWKKKTFKARGEYPAVTTERPIAHVNPRSFRGIVRAMKKAMQ